jgi:peptide/nickel transport system ATP-binding protein
MSAPVLEVLGLSVEFATDRGPLRAVDGVSFSVAAGQTLAIVGESGCGKSVTALAVMGLLPRDVRLGGAIRTSLNPAFTAGEQVAESLRLHEHLSPRAAMDRAVEMLARVRIPDAARRAAQYPHQLSGGMRQRVMIAMALACRPRLLICDEPTTALDVTVQAQILSLLDELKRETGTAVVLTHDLGVVADHADQVAVLYAGRIAEAAPAATIFARPDHPYTVGLLGAVPSIEGGAGRLASIEGTVPDLRSPPPGCRFAPRCPFAGEDCNAQPPLAEVAAGHAAACWRAPLDQVLAA